MGSFGQRWGVRGSRKRLGENQGICSADGLGRGVVLPWGEEREGDRDGSLGENEKVGVI